ncbi:MAG: hypothetical protein U5N56_09480 [Candidatus Marinimicrobia bacterium]|nr:hypothetical protein [Candidatus Neomarinimicrobiota bacterium]
MITSWFTLKKCADYFHRHYRHAVLDHCLTFRKNELMLIFRDRSALTVHLGTPFQYIIPSSRPPSKKRDKVRIFPGIEGNIVEEVFMLPGERIMRFRMKNGTSLNIVFRSNRGNVVFLSENGTEYFKKKLRIDPGLLKKGSEEHYSSLQEDVRFNTYWKKHIAEVLGTGDYRKILEIIHNSNGCMIGKRFVLCNDEKEYDPDLLYANYRAFVIGRLQEQQFYGEYRSLERRINTQLNELQKKLQRTENDEKFIERASRYRFFADILSACRYDIEEHSDKFIIPPSLQGS